MGAGMTDIRTKLDNVPAIQSFAVAAIVVGLLVSYYPPVQNGAAIWALVGVFFGHLMTRLFGDDALPKTPQAQSVPSDKQVLP